MEQDGIDPDTLMMIAALVGAGVGLEGQRMDDDQRLVFRWLFLLQAIGIAAMQAETVRGFLYMLAMPIGCYKIAQVVAEPIGRWWRKRRRYASGSKPTA